MAASTSACRGFTHPVVLLIRSSYPSLAQRSSCAVGRTPCLHLTISRCSTRQLTTYRSLLSKAKTRAPSKPASQAVKAAPKPTLYSQQSRGAAPHAYIQSLLRNEHGTILYEAGPQRLHMFSSYTAAVFCMIGAGANVYFNVFNVPQGLPWFIPYAFGAVGLMLAGMGMTFALRPANAIHMIKVLPARTRAGSTPRPVLEILARGSAPIPGLPWKRLLVEPQDVVMKSRLYHPPARGHLTAEEKILEEQRKKAAREYEMNHLMTAPFRHFGRAMSYVFSHLRKGITGEGFAPVTIHGNKYKLDISSAYALEKGRALDMLVKIEEDPRISRMIARGLERDA